jgi:hypothetical protein
MNSTYTNLLNERYPQRKYLRHNLTSWMKCNKKTDDIMVKLLNPKIKMEDFNLKRLNREAIGIVEENITSLDDAKNIIELLKLKLVDYELTNNKNIEAANEYINKVNEENEFMKKKLLECYEKIAYYEESEGPIVNESDMAVIETFRSRWLKYNAFQMLKYSMIHCKLFKMRVDDFNCRRDQILKLKAFLSLEKHRMISKHCNSTSDKYRYKLLRTVFNGLRFNCYTNMLLNRFKSIQKTVRLMVYMKDMKFNCLYSKYYKELNKKALFKYYFSLTTKSFNALKVNSIKFAAKSKGISFVQFFKNADIDLRQKERKAKGIVKVKQIVDKVITFENNKIINHPNKNYALDIYFSTWRKNASEYKQILQFKAAKRLLYYKLFFKKLFQTSYCKIIAQKTKQNIAYKSFFRFFKNRSDRENHLNRNSTEFMKKFYYQLFFKYMNSMIINQPYLKYVNSPLS